MQAVEQHPYVTQVLDPLIGEQALGGALGEDPVLEFLENEIMKIGSLAHTGIDWGRVERESLQLLADRSKDLKVLGFLLLCLQRGGNGERYALSLYLLHRVLDGWWSEAWPYPAAKGARARKLLFGQVLQRASAEVEKLSFDPGLGDGRSYCLTLMERLIAQATAQGLPDDGLYDLKRQIERLPAANEAPSEQPSAPTVTGPASSPAAVTAAAKDAPVAAATPSLGDLTLDAGNERATRQSLLKVADLLTELSPTETLGYQLRRYAIWNGISAEPPSRDGVKTDLAAVSADRVADYREALAKGADLALWQRIEQSLSLSPFWLEGHWLSAQVADALGHGDCSEAIRLALRRFLDRLPKLEALTFNDGTPFLPKAVADWLLASPAKSGSSGAGWQQAYEQAADLLPRDGLGPAMQRLEDGLADAKEPRDRFYWRLMCTELLRESGMKTLARQQVRDLQEQTRALTLDDWEPGLIARLERLM
ncbi:type VI secretion system protein TssA [Marinobacter zhejiangensis]|uniref:Type VI secretion system protein VasJ n=1 Tax=Marinobacter zhejiangensis TaxID=488535 RepID=A0A1I4LAS4_9GAMM|nr:type VI secretion system protein TssA [Marinobacter zhejiangensis]SFL88158.1 type VI secretion system protein VasJ [Marinobacter zhejiangensis]